MTPVDDLVPYAGNARTHSDAQITQIAASIAEFGFTNPILAGGDKVIIAGHGRLLAAQKLKMAAVPVIVLDDLSEAQRRALVIADNRLAENAGWDEELLRVELVALGELDFDLDLIGFSDEELDDLLGDLDGMALGETEGEDDVPEAPEDPVSRLGDLWILGKHRLLCGDATVATDVERVLNGIQPLLMV
ncbi:MAG: ParB N-terminal domain-containing protein, partial [Alphaproteobacteria bacterium]|nr:ParB N-terminal domain-containing protein [Alphaproteobacteria bacterium]